MEGTGGGQGPGTGGFARCELLHNRQFAFRNEQWGERKEPEPRARARREQGERKAASIADKNHSVNDFWRSDR